MKEIKCCKTCGQSLRANWHTLSDKLAKALILFADKSRGEKARLSDVFKDTPNVTNFQKLRYFGLVEHFRKEQVWRISAKGYQFLRGDIAVPKKVMTVQNKVERFGKDEVFLSDILKENSGWQKVYKPIRLPIRTQQTELFG